MQRLRHWGKLEPVWRPRRSVRARRLLISCVSSCVTFLHRLLTYVIEQIIQEWPLFPQLHAFWREIPSYNPIGASNSAPGQKYAEEAEDLLFNQDSHCEAPEGAPDATGQREDMPQVSVLMIHYS